MDDEHDAEAGVVSETEMGSTFYVFRLFIQVKKSMYIIYDTTFQNIAYSISQYFN